jgi:hypothetical protein
MLEHKTHFAGKTIIDWKPGDPIPDPATTIPRISATDMWGQIDEASGDENFRRFVGDPASKASSGLAFGLWDEWDATTEHYLSHLLEPLLQHHDHFQHLTALFLGDISQEESEISWIELDDVSPLFTAYPQLEHLGIRGNASSNMGLHLGTLHSELLKTLVIESGSMDRSVVHAILRSHLPALAHLELWTGSENYGGNCTVEDFGPLWTGDLFPNLRYLGLRDSEFTDDLAIALSQSPLLERLRELDLSLGTLSDTGAAALLNCPAVRKLAKLDLHHHFCSEEMMQRLQALPIEVDVSEREELQDPEESDSENGRFVAVSE